MEKFDFFTQLSKNELDELTSKSKYVEVAKNTILFYQDDVCEEILYLTQGTVKLSMYVQMDEEIPLYTFQEGEQCIVNVASTLSQTKAVATAQTVTDIKGWLISKQSIKDLMVQSCAYQDFIFSLFALRFSSLTTLLEDIKFKRLDSRILKLLKSYEQNTVHVTHEEIADNLGTSRVVISRVLKDLERKNYIELLRGEIKILK